MLARPINNLAGKRSGKLVAIEPAGYIGAHVSWRCICDCGRVTVVRGNAFSSGNIRSCGCMKNEKYEDFTGRKFGMLTVLEFAGHNKGGYTLWNCVCDCGAIKTEPSTYLRYAKNPNCGRHKEQHKKHGHYGERLYKVWDSMKQRCYSENDISYKNYGGRGIEVCEEWKNNYALFRDWAYSNGYDENAEYGKCTIDRIDVNGNYCPENCRWVDMKTQAQNKRKKTK